ncbi:uncharacterized protein [Arachis hypogaea]|uniref:uncharacterized protein n=1 Tax=Arachis hypogaea TaxID=3818 RepID=UPI000DED3149|nr:uncharacterized protein LOC112717913 [Arachis hypogaea]
MNFQMPKDVILPTTLKSYDRIGDPNIHVTKFHTMMFMNGASDPIFCHTFPTFLDGAVLIWFSNLPAGSISSFDKLADLFVNNFVALKIYVHDSNYLSTIKQRQHESLKDHMTRFAKATMEIPNLKPEVHLHALKSGLHLGKFQKTIIATKSKTLAKFREKSTSQIEIEEL